ncbi:MAG TPA: hypothetical protein VGE74_29975 [Gemmata sp.]
MIEPVYDDEEEDTLPAPKTRNSALSIVVAVVLGVIIFLGLGVIVASFGPGAFVRLIALATLILAPAVLAGLLGKSRPIGARGGFYLGLFLSFLGLIIVLAIPQKEQRRPPQPRPKMKECPYCAERVQLKARICRFCDREIA